MILTIEELKETIRKQMNGEYATWICSNCHKWNCTPDGDTNTAKIISSCQHCFSEKE